MLDTQRQPGLLRAAQVFDQMLNTKKVKFCSEQVP